MRPCEAHVGGPHIVERFDVCTKEKNEHWRCDIGLKRMLLLRSTPIYIVLAILRALARPGLHVCTRRYCEAIALNASGHCVTLN